MILKDFLLTFFQLLKINNLKYCILRNYETLPDKNSGTDIDILLNSENVSLALSVLKSIAQVRIVSVNPRSYVVGVFLDGVIGSDGQDTLQIDLVTKLAWKGMSYLSVSDVLSDAESHGAEPLIRKPALHHEAIISLFSSYLVGGWIKDRYQDRISEVFRKESTRIQKSLAPRVGMQLTQKLISAVSADDRLEMKSLLKDIKRNILFNCIKYDGLGVFWNICAHYFSELKLRYSTFQVIQICVLGVDGAGKSTVINGMLEKLGSRVKDTEIIHLKPRFGSKSNGSYTVVTDPHGKPARSSIISILKLTSWIFSYYRKLIFHGHKNGVLVIWDRYIYDVLVDPLRYRVSLPQWVLTVFSRLAPSMDGLVVLDVPAEVAYARKREVPLEALYGIRAGYLAFAATMENSVVVSTDTEAENSIAELLEFVSTTLAKRAQTTLARLGI